MDKPFLSVCIITYNHVNYIKQAIDGALMQKTDFPIEIIVADDFSTDGTREILQDYLLKIPTNFRLILQDKNVGPAENWMDLMAAPTGKYVAYLDGDDYWIDDNKLQKQVNYLEKNSKVVMCFTNIEVYDNDTKDTKEWAKIEDIDYDITNFIKENAAASCTIVFRNGLVDVSKCNIQNIAFGDWAFYLFLLQFGNAKYLDFISAVYRVSSQSQLSKISLIKYLFKKKEFYYFFLHNPVFSKYKNLIRDRYISTLYALAIRLEKNDKERKKYLRQVIRSVGFGRVLLTIKALTKYVS